MMKDLRLAVHHLVRTRGFTAVAVTTLGLGIGANTAIFSLVNTALLRPIHASRPEELVSLFRARSDSPGDGHSNHPYPDFLDYRERSRDVLSDLAAFGTRPSNLAVGPGEGTQRVNVGLVTENYFGVLSIAPQAGRFFRPDENQSPDTHPVAVVSEALWRRELGAVRDLTDASVWLNNVRYAVVGVAPEAACRMVVIVKIDVFVPAMMQGTLRGDKGFLTSRRAADFCVIGRRRPGVDVPQVQARFDRIASELGEQYPDAWKTRHGRLTLKVIPESESRGIYELRGWTVGFASLLMATAGAVLLIACVNLANLLLARGLARRPELAMRAALGASRWDLVRLLLAESVVLGVLGGAAGLLLALCAKGLFTTFAPNVGVPLAIDLTLDHRVFFFTLVTTIIAVLAFGLAPAMQVITPGLAGDVQEAQHRQLGGPRMSRLRNRLVTAQMAVSIVLLACAASFILAFHRLQAVDIGFRPSSLAVISVDLGSHYASAESQRAFASKAAERLRRLPGVASVDLAERLPLDFSRVRMPLSPTPLDGEAAGESAPRVGFNQVGPAYFDVMQIPVLRGRVFTQHEVASAASVMVVNEAAARRFWPDAEPVGQRLYEIDGSARDVVGVVKTGRYESLLEEATPFVYTPFSPRSVVTFHVRSEVAPAILLEPMRREVLALDPRVAVFGVKTMTSHLGTSLAPIRFGAHVVGLFGALALALAALGLYGVIAYFVRQRNDEIGVRLALGAEPRHVLHWVMRQGLRPVLWGAVIGLAPALGLTVATGMVLFGFSLADIVPLAAATALQAAIALLACWIPGQRAARMDPVAALRND